MVERAIGSLQSILQDSPWLSELAGILPLSALLDFIDVPRKLHMFQLVGGVPLWSWPVTPAGSRLLLSSNVKQQQPCLDQYGSSVSLVALDGRYGEHYFVSNPETFRLALRSHQAVTINNLHDNMAGAALREQNLEIIHVCRTIPHGPRKTIAGLVYESIHSTRFWAVSTVGWMAFLACLAATVVLRLYFALAFLALMPATGLVVHAMYGGRPRRLLVDDASAYNRLVVVAEHMNAADWIVVYGESTLVNSLLNRPLEASGPKPASSAIAGVLRVALRSLILGQWAMAIAAAATKNWNSFFICFWVVFSISTHAYLIPPTSLAKDWLRSCAKVKLRRYQTQVSSRRALLNTLVALNPDTFPETSAPQGLHGEDRTGFSKEGMRWIDPILKPTHSRTAWEGATREALEELSGLTPADLTSELYRSSEVNFLSAGWNSKYRGKECYWKKFITEGIYVAASIRRHDELFRRKVSENLS